MNEDIDREQAHLCRVFTHPARIRVIEALGQGERRVSDLAWACGLAQPTVSQHLAVLRQAGVVATRREGTSIHYRLADDRILAACKLMRAVLIDRLRRAGEQARRARKPSGRRTRPETRP
jgi:ArsR family transcriptional regulator